MSSIITRSALWGRSETLNLWQPTSGDGCVLWFPGQDDPQSSTIRDRSGQGNNGTVANATWAKNDRGLWVLDLDGTDDYVDLGATTFDALTTLSVFLWFKPDIDMDSQAENKPLFEFRQDDGNFIMLYYHAGNNYIRWGAYIGSSWSWSINTGSGEGETQVWHSAAVKCGASGAELWIDKSSIGTDADTECIADIAATTNNYIGSCGRYATEWAGYIALPRFLNTAITLADVTTWHNNERHLFGV